jgi:CBS domain containing-hemolysin-like protein
MKLKSQLYKKEQDEIINKIITILELDKDHGITLHTLDNDTLKQDKILELVMESELHHQLSVQDKKLMISVASFKDRIAREIMVPRIDIVMLSSNSTVDEAAKNFVAEGYSRIPVYKNTLDNINGVLLYKDLLNVYLQQHDSSILKTTSIESLIKPVVYTPETKKISILLQEMKAKQIHMAIVVDEYGGTEGIVTIEDILEELVGEIADEYDDLQEEVLFKPHPQGGWIVDAKMNIVDIEKEMAILIPQSPEYDTVGGYIFHRAGAIPTKGWKIHHENFDLEILKTSDRSVEKVRIISLQTEEL